jgi:hypothetical protein
MPDREVVPIMFRSTHRVCSGRVPKLTIGASGHQLCSFQHPQYRKRNGEVIQTVAAAQKFVADGFHQKLWGIRIGVIQQIAAPIIHEGLTKFEWMKRKSNIM